MQYTDRDKNKWYPNVRRDWVIIFLCGAVSSTLFLLLHLSLYINMSTDGFFSSPSTPQGNVVQTIDRQGLTKVLADFAVKKDRLDQIAGDHTPTVDPSTGFLPATISAPIVPTNTGLKTVLSQ